MRQRIWVWYESGMAETYLYSCLVQAVEDEMKEGLVLYDARSDWKHKADLLVLIRNEQIGINAFWGSVNGRTGVEGIREEVERERKVNTLNSSHWGNQQREQLHWLSISRSEQDSFKVNGVRLFTIRSINTLLRKIYTIGMADREFFFNETCQSGKVYR